MTTQDPDDTSIRESTPNAGGPQGAAGGMGVSSERVGPTGPGQQGTDGVRATHPEEPDGDTPPEQQPGGVEEKPIGIPRKAAPDAGDVGR